MKNGWISAEPDTLSGAIYHIIVAIVTATMMCEQLAHSYVMFVNQIHNLLITRPNSNTNRLPHSQMRWTRYSYDHHILWTLCTAKLAQCPVGPEL